MSPLAPTRSAAGLVRVSHRARQQPWLPDTVAVSTEGHSRRLLRHQRREHRCHDFFSSSGQLFHCEHVFRSGSRLPEYATVGRTTKTSSGTNTCWAALT